MMTRNASIEIEFRYDRFDSRAELLRTVVQDPQRRSVPCDAADVTHGKRRGPEALDSSAGDNAGRAIGEMVQDEVEILSACSEQFSGGPRRYVMAVRASGISSVS